MGCRCAKLGKEEHRTGTQNGAQAPAEGAVHNAVAGVSASLTVQHAVLGTSSSLDQSFHNIGVEATIVLKDSAVVRPGKRKRDVVREQKKTVSSRVDEKSDHSASTCAESHAPNGSDRNPSASGGGRLEERFDLIHKLCREAKILEAGAELKALDLDMAAASQQFVANSSCILASSIERINSDVVLKKLRLMLPRVEAQLKPDGLLSVALRGRKDAWISGRVADPSIGEHFSLEIGVRWLDNDERDPNGPVCQFILVMKAKGWPQKLQEFTALARELDLAKKDLVQDCTEYKGTPGGPEQLMSAMVRYVIRPALCPVNLEFVLCREFVVLKDAVLPEYPAGLMIWEEALPSGVSDFEGWPLPPTKFGFQRMSQKMVWYALPSPEHFGCCNCTQVGWYGVGVPKWLAPLSLIHRICMGIIHKTLKKLILGALPQFHVTHVPRMQQEGVQQLYEAVAEIKPSVTSSESKEAASQ